MISLRLIAVLLSLPTLLGIIVVCADRQWKVSVTNRGFDPSLVTSYYAGLWSFCQSVADVHSTGNCRKYDVAITQLHASIIGQRALMILSCILGPVSAVMALLATDEVNLMSTASKKITMTRIS